MPVWVVALPFSEHTPALIILYQTPSCLRTHRVTIAYYHGGITTPSGTDMEHLLVSNMAFTPLRLIEFLRISKRHWCSYIADERTSFSVVCADVK